jgi:hypothetical protein
MGREVGRWGLGGGEMWKRHESIREASMDGMLIKF